MNLFWISVVLNLFFRRLVNGLRLESFEEETSSYAVVCRFTWYLYWLKETASKVASLILCLKNNHVDFCSVIPKPFLEIILSSYNQVIGPIDQYLNWTQLLNQVVEDVFSKTTLAINVCKHFEQTWHKPITNFRMLPISLKTWHCVLFNFTVSHKTS